MRTGALWSSRPPSPSDASFGNASTRCIGSIDSAAEGDDHLVASTENPPRPVEAHLHIAPWGRLLNIVAQRWEEVTKGTFAYLRSAGTCTKSDGLVIS